MEVPCGVHSNLSPPKRRTECGKFSSRKDSCQSDRRAAPRHAAVIKANSSRDRDMVWTYTKHHCDTGRSGGHQRRIYVCPGETLFSNSQLSLDNPWLTNFHWPCSLPSRSPSPNANTLAVSSLSCISITKERFSFKSIKVPI